MRNNKVEEIICVSCPKGCRIKVESKDDEIIDISGFGCKEGKRYAREEFKNPTRILPTTVKVKGGEFPLVSVKTKKGIPKDKLLKAMEVIAKIEVKAPVEIGDIILDDILDTGVELVATRNIKKVE